MSAKMNRAARRAPEAAQETSTTSRNSTPGGASWQGVPTRISVLTSLTGALSKAYGWRNDKLEKQPAPQLYEGSCRSVEITCLGELAALLDQLQDNQALALCNVARDVTAIVVDEKADPLDGTIARTKEHFWWDPSARAFMLFDVDVSGYSVEQVLKLIRNFDHAFAAAAAVGRYSTSSYINGPNEFTTGPKGVHLYVLVDHPELMEDAGKILAKRLWLAGSGRIALARNGRMLVRQLIDALVWSPERLIYEVSPVLRNGLTQDRPPTEVFPGEIVDLSLVTPLTGDEEAEYKRMVADAKDAMLPKALRKFDHYLANAAFEQRTTPEELGKKWLGLKPNIHSSVDTVLAPDFPLDLGKHGEMTVAALVAKLDAGERIRGNFPDPVEGETYNPTCAYVQPERTRTGYWRIYSHAHGGIAYLLGREMTFGEDDAEETDSKTAPAVDVLSIAATVRGAISKLEKDPGALFDSPELREALQQVRRADRGEWARLRKEILAKRAFKAEELDDWMAAENCTTTGDGGAGEQEDIAEPDLTMILVNLVRQHATLSYQDELTGVVIVNDNGRCRVHLVPSLGFVILLRGLYYAHANRGISDTTVKTVTQTILAACVATGSRVQTHIRVACGPDGAYYIDLCDDAGRAVRVTAGAWDVISNPPVLFLRPRDALPLPEPQRLTASWRNVLLEHLLEHLNLPWTTSTGDPRAKHGMKRSMDWLLLLAFILDAFRPDTPYPVLEIDGEQGSAKSGTQKRIRDVIDPHAVPLRASPKATEDIFIAAANNHVISFENVSSLKADQQDALCVVSTGGGHAGRTFYTNGEEFSIKAKRPVILNGIGAAATRPDLIDRVVHIELPSISDTARKSERELDAAWEQSRTLAFSALMDCFAETLKQLPNVKLTKRPRMADFAELGAALAIACGGKADLFLNALDANRAEGLDRAIDTFPVGVAVLDFLTRQPGGFSGTASDLFKELKPDLVGQENSPRSTRGMSGQLKRVAPALKARGVAVSWGGHTRTGNRITVRAITPPTPQPATMAAPVPKP